MKAAIVLALIATAAHAEPPKLERVEPPPNARTEAWVATGVTAAIVGLGAFSVVRMKQDLDRANEIKVANGEAVDWTAADRSADRWFHRTLLFGGMAVASTVVTGILWSRAQPSYRVSVAPQGVYIGYSRSF